MKSALWCRQDGHHLEESFTKAILGFQKLCSKCNKNQWSPFHPVTAYCKLQPPRRHLLLLLYPEVSFYFISNLSSDKSGIATLPLNFFIPVEFYMNNFIAGDLRPLCKFPCEMSSMPTALGNMAANVSGWNSVVCLEDTGGRRDLRDDAEGLLWHLGDTSSPLRSTSADAVATHAAWSQGG